MITFPQDAIKEFIFFAQLDPSGNVTLTQGYSIDIMKTLSRTLNFHLELSHPPDNAWGAKDANGSWDGIVGMLINDDADVSVSSLTVTFDRSMVIDFTPTGFYNEIITVNTRVNQLHILLLYYEIFY